MWQPKTWSGLICALCLVGCSQPAEVTVREESAGLHIPSSIAQIMRPTVAIQELSPEQTRESVQVEGQVVRQAPLLAGSLYQLQDDSGTIWVFSEAAAPAVSASVRVVGTVQVEPIRVEGIDISDFYLVEGDRQLINGNPPTETLEPSEAAPDATAPEDTTEN